MASNNKSESPILALEGNILWQFENISKNNAKKLQEQVELGLLSENINLCKDTTPPKGPHIKNDFNQPPTIELHTSFLELLWAFIYSWIIIFEEGHQRPQLPDNELPTGPTPDDLIDRAYNLLQ